MNSIRHAVMEHIGRCGSYFYKANKTGSVLPPYLIKTGSSIPSGRTVCGHSGWSAFHWNVMSCAASRFLGNRKHRVYHTRIVLGGSSPIDNCFIGGRSPCRYIRRQAFYQLFHIIISHIVFIIRKSKFPQNPKRSVRFSGKRTKRSVQKRKARNTQKAETKVL